MIDDLIEAIAIQLNKDFMDCTIYTGFVPQGFNEPCFFILVLNMNEKQIVGNRYLRSQKFDIIYFPTSTLTNANNECLSVANQLFNSLEVIPVKGDLIRGKNIYNELVDGVLHCFVEFSQFVYKEVSSPDNMETVVVSNNVKG